MDSMEVFDPEDTVSDSGPAERLIENGWKVALGVILFWAFVAWLIFG